MIYRTQCETIRVCRQDAAFLSIKVIFPLLGEVSSSYNFHDPKQKTRLEFYFDLLEKYRYPLQRIEFDVAAPDNDPIYLADIVVFKDTEGKNPYIVVECCKEEISDKNFQIGIKAAIAKAEMFGAEFAVCVTSAKQRVVKLTYENGAVYSRTVCDLPVLYGVG